MCILSCACSPFIVVYALSVKLNKVFKAEIYNLVEFKKTMIVPCQYFRLYLLMEVMFHFLLNSSSSEVSLHMCCGVVPKLMLKIYENDLHLTQNPS